MARAVQQSVESFTPSDVPKEDEVRAFTAAAVDKVSTYMPQAAQKALAEGRSGVPVPAMTRLAKTKTTAEHVFNSEKNLDRIRSAERARSEAERIEESKGMIFFVRCRPHYHHGIYLKENPKHKERFGMFDWEAAYKDFDQPNPYHRDIYCQECWREMNKLELLPVFCVDPINFLFEAEHEHVFEMPHPETPEGKARALRDGPEPHRVFPGAWESSDWHFKEREAKRAAYDLRMQQQAQKVGA